jgi:hypothetical protein
VIVVADYADYSMFCDRLRDLGFVNDTSPDAPMCRFLYSGLMLDVMSTHEVYSASPTADTREQRICMSMILLEAVYTITLF